MSQYTIAVDTLLMQSKTLVVFSGLTAQNQRIRVVTSNDVTPQIGEAYIVRGEFEYHEKYKKQLIATNVERTDLSGRLIVPFLVNKLPGVGPERASRLMQFFGNKLGDILSSPDDIEIVAAALNKSGNISDHSLRLAIQAHDAWLDQRNVFATLVWLEKQGVTDPVTGRQVARILGENAPLLLDQNPYLLSGLLPWTSVEKIGLPLLRGKITSGSAYQAPERLLGAIDSVMRTEISKGNTAILKDELPIKLKNKLQSQNPKVIQRAIQLGINFTALIDGGEYWRAPGCAFMEDDLSKRFSSMAYGDSFGLEKTAVHIPPVNQVREILLNVTSEQKLNLHPEQLAAAEKILSLQLAVLRGGAGTGKTTVVSAIAETWKSMGGHVELAALAGKAALRLSESSACYARTIYRLLKGLEARDLRGNGEGLPQLDSKTLLIVDESSMVDLGLFHQIHQAMPSGCRLLLVGDPAQLPPIGFGLVFHLLAEEKDITVTLKKIHRQDDVTGIPVVARAIKDGVLPSFQQYTGLSDGVSFVEIAKSDITSKIKEIVEELGGFNKSHDLLICTALNAGPASVDDLNDVFSRKNAMLKKIEPLKGYLKQWFLPGDPVIYLRNNYSEGLFNGSLGWVKEIDTISRKVVAVFGVGLNAEEKTIVDKDLIYLQLAYGITCHKAQGSQAKRVIIPIMSTDLLEPTWLYTAITRAESQCVIVGEKKDLIEAIGRVPAYKNRKIGFIPFKEKNYEH